MADIHLRRPHSLGLAEARRLAQTWTAEAEQKLGMACSTTPGEAQDTVHFTRSGVTGALVVAADYFEVTAKLGFLLGSFAPRIEAEIEKNLDRLLGQAGAA